MTDGARTGVNLEFARKYVGARVLEQALGYLARDPDRNLMRLLDLAERFAPLEEHRRQIRELKVSFNRYPAYREYARRLFTEVNVRVRQKMAVNWFVNSALLGIPKQRRLSEELGVNVPFFLLVDPTSACNLRCKGCWAGEYDKHDVMEPELLDRIIREAKELGIHWIVLSGGEPLCYPHLFDIVSKHDDVAFMFYTNGTLIDEAAADRIAELGNISPAISLEGGRERTDARRGRGTFDKVMHAMDLLKERGALFGFSVTITRENAEEVVSDEFLDLLIEKGCLYGWTFHYIPVGSDARPDLMVTPEQRAYLARRVPEIRRIKPLQFADFWNDGELTGGCIAGGRRYFHITARGDVEPCAFAHFAVDNIRDKSLKEVLQSPIFKAYQKRQPFSENLLRPCPIIDVPEALQEIVAESGARPTHPGAEAILSGELAAAISRRAETWARLSEPIWQERQRARQQVSAGS